MSEGSERSGLEVAEKRGFAESDLLPISRLADVEFCERRAALHLIEMVWEDNVHTAGGTVMHERVHADCPSEKRGATIIARDLWVRSLRLGLVGKADIVEMHRVDESDTADAAISGHRGRWRVYPVEYKPGRFQRQASFQIQLCAQAICLEEMLDVGVSSGAIFYGRARHRLNVDFDGSLREATEKAAARLHELVESGKTPKPIYTNKCRSCSLFDQCLPQAIGKRRSVAGYLDRMLSGGDR